MSTDRNPARRGIACFFTVTLSRDSGYSLIEGLPVLRDAYRRALAQHPFKTEAIVVLPDHLHAVWTLPEGDEDFTRRWHIIRRHVAQVARERTERQSGRDMDGGADLWQPQIWGHEIRDAADLLLHREYCWSDPVRHGLVSRAADWIPTSFHRDVRAGLVSADWAGAPVRGVVGKRPSVERCDDLAPTRA